MPSSSPRLQPVWHLGFLTVAAALLWAYWPTWMDLINTWQSDPDYNHGFLVIPISLWLLWSRRAELSSIQMAPSWWGLVPLSMAGMMRWLGAEFFLPQLDAWSIAIWIAGVVLLCGGWQLLRWSAGSIAFLWFMTPLPASLTDFVSLPLQQVSAVVSTWFLHLFALPAIRQGTTISLGEQVLDVERACSGLRICYGTLAVAVGYVLMVRPGKFRAGMLIIAAIPLAILANSFRVTFTGVMFQFVSGETAHQYAHDFFGIVMLPLAIGLLWLFHFLTIRVETAFRKSVEAGTKLVMAGAAVVVVVGAGAMFWQARQADASIDTLLEVAARHETDAEALESVPETDQEAIDNAWWEAVISLDQYCRLRPEDAEAARRFALATEHFANSRPGAIRAARLFQKAWELNPDDQELALKSAALATSGGLNEEAIAICQELLPSTVPGSDEQRRAFRLQIVAMTFDPEGRGNQQATSEELIAALQYGIDNNIDASRCAYQMASVYREEVVESLTLEERNEKADALLDDLVDARPDDPDAWFARYQYRTLYSETPDSDNAAENPADADADLDRAMQLAEGADDPGMRPVWLAAADRALTQDRFEAAKGLYEKAVQVDPDHHRGYLQLARLATGLDGRIAPDSEVTTEQRQAAIAILKDALSLETLKREALLQFALIRHQLWTDDSVEIAEANARLKSLSEEAEEMDSQVGAVLRINVAILEAEAAARGDDPARGVSILNTALSAENTAAIPSDNGLLGSALLLLGNCYEQQGLDDEARECFGRAIEAAPNASGTIWRQAFAAEQSDDIAAASSLYANMADRFSQRPEPWLAVARVELRAQQQLSIESRELSNFENAMDRAKAAGAAVDELAVLQSQFWSLSGNSEEAISALEQAIADVPESAALHRSLVALHLANGDQSGADTALERLRSVSESPAVAAMTEATLFVESGNLSEARAVLDRAIAGATDREEQRALVSQSVRIEIGESNLDAAQQRLQQFADDDPTDKAAQLQLAEFCLTRQSFGPLEELEDRLQKIEGPDGIQWQDLRARRIFEQAIRDQDPVQQAKLVSESKKIAKALEAKREAGPEMLFLLGRIAILERQYLTAIEYLETAWQKQPASGDRAAELIIALRAAGSTDKAQQYLLQMSQLIAVTPSLFDQALDLESSIILNNRRQAETIARGWTQSVGDADSYLRLARVLSIGASQLSGERFQEVDTAFREAIKLAPAEAEPREALLRFLYRYSNSPTQTIRELDAVLAVDGIPEADRAMIAARLLTEMGARGPASRFWRKATQLASAAADISARNRVLTSATLFYMESDPTLAEQRIRKVLVSTPDDQGASALLLGILAEADNPEAHEAAATLIQSMKSSGDALTDAARRAIARALYRRVVVLPAEFTAAVDLPEAARLLSGIPKPLESDVMLQALITGQLGNENAALLRLSEVAGRTSASPASVRTFVEYSQDEFADSDALSGRVENALAKVERMPGAEALSLELRLRPAASTRNQQLTICREFVKRVAGYHREPAARDEMLQQAMRRLTQLNHHQLVLDLYRGADLEPFGKAQTLVAVIAAAIAKPGSEAFEQSFQALLAVELDELKSLQADRVAADYFLLRGELELAEKCYRRCLEKEPESAGVINNLAMVLAELDHFDEAESLLTKAMELTARENADDAFIQDTQAWIHIRRGKLEDAYTILSRLTDSAEAYESTFLHLAECTKQMGRLAESREALEVAQQIGVVPSLLPPMDRELYETLCTEFDATTETQKGTSATVLTAP